MLVENKFIEIEWMPAYAGILFESDNSFNYFTIAFFFFRFTLILPEMMKSETKLNNGCVAIAHKAYGVALSFKDASLYYGIIHISEAAKSKLNFYFMPAIKRITF